MFTSSPIVNLVFVWKAFRLLWDFHIGDGASLPSWYIPDDVVETTFHQWPCPWSIPCLVGCQWRLPSWWPCTARGPFCVNILKVNIVLRNIFTNSFTPVHLPLQEMERELMDLQAKDDAARALSWAYSSSKPWSGKLLQFKNMLVNRFLNWANVPASNYFWLFLACSPNILSKQPIHAAQANSLQSLERSSRPQVARMHCWVLCLNAALEKLWNILHWISIQTHLQWWFQWLCCGN